MANRIDYSQIPKEELKEMRWEKLDMLTINKTDLNGRRMPFFIRYCGKDGKIISQNNVLCTSVDRFHSTRRVKFLDTEDTRGNSETRTLRDILILQIDNYRIVRRKQWKQ